MSRYSVSEKEMIQNEVNKHYLQCEKIKDEIMSLKAYYNQYLYQLEDMIKKTGIRPNVSLT